MKWLSVNILDVSNGQCYGCVDIGNGIIIEDGENRTSSGKALVIMVVALNASWKLPLGYFLINGLCGEERANNVNESLYRLHGVGVKVVEVTCGGPSCNLSMIKELGVDLHVLNIKSTFPHPADSDQNVSVVLDPCHNYA